MCNIILFLVLSCLSSLIHSSPSLAMLQVKKHFSDSQDCPPPLTRHNSTSYPGRVTSTGSNITQDEFEALQTLIAADSSPDQVTVEIHNDTKKNLLLSIKDPAGQDYHPPLVVKSGHEITFDIVQGAPLWLKAVEVDTPSPKTTEHKVNENFRSFGTKISTWNAPNLRRSPLRFASHTSLPVTKLSK